MDSRTLLFVFSLYYIVDVNNAVMCYACTGDNPACGATVGSGIPQVSCAGQCMVSKTSMSLGGAPIDIYSRTCEAEFCFDSCMNVDGMTICGNCCSDELCNDAFVDPPPPPPVADNLMCYNCSLADNPACGEMLGDASNVESVPCTGSCGLMKSTVTLGTTTSEMYQRMCMPFCQDGCVDIEGAGNVCTTCCSATSLCNGDSPQPGGGAAPGGGATPGGGAAPGGGATPGGSAQPEAEAEPTPPKPKNGVTPPADNDADGKGDSNPAGAQAEGTQPPAQDSMMTTKSSAITVVVNVATILFTYLLSTTVF